MDLKDIFDKINTDYENTQQGDTTNKYWVLSTSMQDAESSLREHIQEITKEKMTEVIKKLKSQETLNAEDIEYVKLWIVGDAEYYANLENNYNDWKNELSRLINEINKIDTEEPDFYNASKLRALLLDGIRVLGDIVFYIKQKDRVNAFVESTEEINEQERMLLIELLEGKMRSPNE